MKKGFLHIVEVIIMVMLIFVMILQFSTIPKMRTNWDRSKLILMSHDLLYSLERTGIDWFNTTETKEKIEEVLPVTMGFSVSISQDVRPLIKVGCVCNQQDFNVLREEILTDFDLNGHRRYFDIERIDPLSIKFPADSDVIFFWGYRDLDGLQQRDIKRFVSEGKGVVEFSTLEQYQAEEPWHQDIFNLEWVYPPSYYHPSVYADFYTRFPAERGYKTNKFFFKLPYELVPDYRMVGYWRMNMGSGEDVWDTSLNTNYGILRDDDGNNADGNQTAVWVDGMYGSALLFDGTDDYAEIPDDSSLRLSTFTTEARFKIDQLPADPTKFVILEKGEDIGTGNSNYKILLVRNSSVFGADPKIACGFDIATGGEYLLVYSINASHTGRFVHVACTLRGNDWYMYLDGKPVTADVYLDGTFIPGGLSGEVPSLANAPLYIGAGYDNNTGFEDFFDGAIDEVIIYDTELSPGEILDSYERKFPDTQRFDNFVSENVSPVNNPRSKIIVEQESRYIGGSHDGESVPLATIHWGVEGNGLSAWMSSAPLTPENRHLLKSLVIWAASGKEYDVVEGELKDKVKASLHRILNSDMHEAVRIDLTIGYYY